MKVKFHYLFFFLLQSLYNYLYHLQCILHIKFCLYCLFHNINEKYLFFVDNLNILILIQMDIIKFFYACIYSNEWLYGLYFYVNYCKNIYYILYTGIKTFYHLESKISILQLQIHLKIGKLFENLYNRLFYSWLCSFFLYWIIFFSFIFCCLQKKNLFIIFLFFFILLFLYKLLNNFI